MRILKYLFGDSHFDEIHSLIEPENHISVHIVENNLRFDFIHENIFFQV